MLTMKNIFFSLNQVSRHVNDLRSRSGEPIVKLSALQTAQVKSIQGQWTPLTHQNPLQNLSHASFPQPEFSDALSTEVSATEYVLLNSEPINEETEKAKEHHG